MTRLGALLPATDRGRAMLVGLVMLAIGLLLWWPPAALIVPGALLLVLALLTPPETPEAGT